MWVYMYNGHGKIRRRIKPQLPHGVTKSLDDLTAWSENSFTNGPIVVNSSSKNKSSYDLTCPSDIRFPSIVSSLPLLSRIFVLIPLHLVPMVSKASYNGCDQRIIIIHSESLKYLNAYHRKLLCIYYMCYIKYFGTSLVM